MEQPPTTRAQRRRRTEERILSVARGMFAERGFERTTIRAVAAAAEVDPALVMQYFGSKQELFDQAVRLPPIPPLEGDTVELIEELLARIGMKIGPIPEGSLAMMRSMLTHPDAADRARATLDDQVATVGAAIGAEDADLRAALMISTMLGVTIAHQLLDLSALREVSAERIAQLLRPSLKALADAEAAAD
ncbi:TetR family transcriptional regulator [Planotetraspora thailandica]|uniref:TetR family transcriptional regulator n=1 Tax=Planotetraspora thailandica TaxID=487172 RepID=A0A8J3V106_9ACTN|nr:TetR/AcrR family transcriptional regulator [Planotetraspora thailandica]GII54250.1 TetR family transcriptional regulator [Planotetraspora thailandica]